MSSQFASRPAPRQWSGWKIAAAVITITLALFGLAVIAAVVFIYISFSSYGSNK
jgi:hypothetical protein